MQHIAMASFLLMLHNTLGIEDILGICTGGYCPGTEGGTLISPNFPLGYPSRSAVNYTIETLLGSNIELTFTSLDLERSYFNGECPYDRITVYDSDNAVIGPFCGTGIPPGLRGLVSLSNKMVVEFVSDHHDHRGGFSATWRRVETFNETAGYITTPDYPNNYPSCQNVRLKVITGPKGTRVRMQILDLKLSNGGAQIIVTEGTPGPRWRENNLSCEKKNSRAKSSEYKKILRQEARNDKDQRFLSDADIIARIYGYTKPSEWSFQSKSNSVSVYFVEWGYQPRRKGMKMAWFLDRTK